MSSGWVTIAQVTVAGLTGLVALLGAVQTLTSGVGRTRRLLQNDVEILSKLPKDSVAYKAMLNYIGAEIKTFAGQEMHSTRDTGAAVMAAVTTLLCTAGSIYALRQGGWWYVLLMLTVPLGLICSYGIFESAEKVPRDKDGKRV